MSKHTKPLINASYARSCSGKYLIRLKGFIQICTFCYTGIFHGILQVPGSINPVKNRSNGELEAL